MKNKSHFIERDNAELEIRNVQVVSDFAEASPFAKNGYVADEFSAFITFDMAHTLPGVWLGPVSSGDTIGFLGDTLWRDHTKLRHKQFNYRHQVKAYAPKGEQAGKRDRIIGCILDTFMDPKPLGGFWHPQTNPDGGETCIHCCAVVFKLAEGVDEMLGNHLASREKQGVSIEVFTTLDNLTVLRPSTNEMFPYLDLPEAWAGALKKVPGRTRPRVAKLDGEQLIVVYGGMGKPINFRGAAMTPDPAEKFAGTNTYAAEITSVNAENADLEIMAVAAESVPQLLCGERIRFDTGRYGIVSGVITEGVGGPHRAKPGNPVLRVTMELSGTTHIPLRSVVGKFL